MIPLHVGSTCSLKEKMITVNEVNENSQFIYFENCMMTGKWLDLEQSISFYVQKIKLFQNLTEWLEYSGTTVHSYLMSVDSAVHAWQIKEK